MVVGVRPAGVAVHLHRSPAPLPSKHPAAVVPDLMADPQRLAVVVVECALRNATHRGGISANSVLRGSHPDSSELSVSTVGLQMQKRNEKEGIPFKESHGSR